jgi:hypothetical protein
LRAVQAKARCLCTGLLARGLAWGRPRLQTCRLWLTFPSLDRIAGHADPMDAAAAGPAAEHRAAVAAAAVAGLADGAADACAEAALQDRTPSGCGVANCRAGPLQADFAMHCCRRSLQHTNHMLLWAADVLTGNRFMDMLKSQRNGAGLLTSSTRLTRRWRATARRWAAVAMLQGRYRPCWGTSLHRSQRIAARQEEAASALRDLR